MEVNETDGEFSWTRRCSVRTKPSSSVRDETPPRHRQFPEPCGWEAPSVQWADEDDDDDDYDYYSTGTGAALMGQSPRASKAEWRNDAEADWAQLEKLLLEEWRTAHTAFQRQGRLLDMYFAFRERYEPDAEQLVGAELHQDIVEWDDERWMLLGFREARAMARVARGRRTTCDRDSCSQASSTFTVESAAD